MKNHFSKKIDAIFSKNEDVSVLISVKELIVQKSTASAAFELGLIIRWAIVLIKSIHLSFNELIINLQNLLGFFQCINGDDAFNIVLIPIIKCFYLEL